MRIEIDKQGVHRVVCRSQCHASTVKWWPENGSHAFDVMYRKKQASATPHNSVKVVKYSPAEKKRIARKSVVNPLSVQDVKKLEGPGQKRLRIRSIRKKKLIHWDGLPSCKRRILSVRSFFAVPTEHFRKAITNKDGVCPTCRRAFKARTNPQ